jgi:hypothetical protein
MTRLLPVDLLSVIFTLFARALPTEPVYGKMTEKDE